MYMYASFYNRLYKRNFLLKSLTKNLRDNLVKICFLQKEMKSNKGCFYGTSGQLFIGNKGI